MMKTEEIDAILANPEAYSVDIAHEAAKPAELQYSSRIDLFNYLATQKRDLDQHANLLRLAASKCQHVTEVSNRRESSIFLMAGNPELLISYQSEADPVLELQRKLLANESGHARPITWTLTTGPIDRPVLRMDETELLFINVEPTYARVKAELDRNGNKATRYLMIANAGTFGEKGSDGEKGLRYAITEFVNENPEWYFHGMATVQNGLLTLSRVLADKPKYQLYPWQKNCGPGTELKKVLAWFGIHDSEECQCKNRMIKMDGYGCDWCRENISEIVGWMREEHIRRKGRFFSRIGAKLLVRLAIARARWKKADCK